MQRRAGYLSLAVVLGFLLVTNPVVSEAAGKITGAMIKDGTVTTADVKNASLRAKDFKAGALPAGPPGPAGPAGSPDTPAQVLEKLAQADGSGSGLDADLLDGLDASTFARSADVKAGFVASSGLFNGTPGVTVSRNSVGDYRLDLGSNNQTCAPTVTVEDDFALVRLVFLDAETGFDVEIANTAGTLTDRAFDFVAICLPGGLSSAKVAIDR